jgi:uncharacterized protein (DUF2062 family)
MLFRRRTPPALGERLRTMVWPRRSLLRSAKYLAKRVLRLRATPHAVAAGVAAGVFASFFPLGFHFIIAAVVSWLIAGNLVAAALGTAVGNPLTFPLLWGASWETGKLMLHEEGQQAVPAHLGAMLHDLSFAQLWEPILKPMTIGAVPLGLVSGLVFYGLTRWAMTVFQNKRRQLLAEKAGAARSGSTGTPGTGSVAR